MTSEVRKGKGEQSLRQLRIRGARSPAQLGSTEEGGFPRRGGAKGE